MTKPLFAGALALAAAGLLTASAARAQDLVFLSTQLRPIEEAQKVREVILKGAPKTTYVVDEPSPFTVRMRAEQEAGKKTVSLVGALHGELQPLLTFNALDPIDDVAAKVASRGIPAGLMELGKLGSGKQVYIPWMQATYVMVVNKKALPYLPAGADVNALTYAQLAEWGKALAEKTGSRKLGFPAGPKGLFARFLQGNLLPSYTKSMVTEFRSAAAETMWGDFKAVWAGVNPNASSYDFMQEPLMAGEVWVAWDHVARVKDALQQAPNDYVVVAPPAGPKGRAYMPVVAGLAIPKGAPDRAGAVALIEHLTKPETQVITAAEVGFFPVVDAKLPADLSPGVKLLAEGVARTQTAKDALVALLPIGLGDKGGEFNKVYFDTFQRIVLRNEPIRPVLDAQAEVMRGLIDATKAPCWAPDEPSTGPCPVK
ncbi:extracellular solute-binding protein [Alsobacter sp. SYSU M60028]|uniref:Extracellular solute-binding protein n=1 Tax=Alsobacter ponti TaxID=2962936 RepID=A0ABT1LDF1_9HYPH|nr:extracellular solute-binding protein [Alsobacter ponti]MCP8939118.1 extracellular solute-binding protein [Alsobacter ponti]